MSTTHLPTAQATETDLAEFAAAVSENAANPAALRFGDRKVYISALRRRLPARYEHLTDAEYKALLVAANQARLLTLARADLPHAMIRAEVEASHIHHLGSDFHFVIDETAR